MEAAYEPLREGVFSERVTDMIRWWGFYFDTINVDCFILLLTQNIGHSYFWISMICSRDLDYWHLKPDCFDIFKVHAHLVLLPPVTFRQVSESGCRPAARHRGRQLQGFWPHDDSDGRPLRLPECPGKTSRERQETGTEILPGEAQKQGELPAWGKLKTKQVSLVIIHVPSFSCTEKAKR